MYTAEQLAEFPIQNWEPVQRAVLCFVFRDDEVLLIEKKRGLGAGKINGPGGKIDPGETALESAIRETQEEVGITPDSPKACG
ncbi:MAG: NUDIX domain-containing protein, partial [Verrucomicrobiota bacterium]